MEKLQQFPKENYLGTTVEPPVTVIIPLIVRGPFGFTTVFSLLDRSLGLYKHTHREFKM